MALEFKVAGVSFRPNYPQNLLEIREHMRSETPPVATFHLLREPDNEFDPNAIRVRVVLSSELGKNSGLWIDGEYNVGYVPKALAAELAPQLDAGKEFHVSEFSIDTSDKHPDRPGMTLHINEPAEVEVA